MIVKSILANIFLFLILISLTGCGAARKEATGPAGDIRARHEPLLAILPIQNYSATPAPLHDLRQTFAERLRQQGIRLLPDEELEAFMARHRLRHVGGIGREISMAFAEEADVDGVIITYLEEYRKKGPPKLSMMARLITTAGLPMVVWMDGISFAGNETPGLLGLGLEDDIHVLEKRALAQLAFSLAGHFAGQPPLGVKQAKQETEEVDTRPTIQYKSPKLRVEKRHTVAIMPFLNESERRFAGELIGLHFLQHMVTSPEEYGVIEPGVVRNELLASRVVIPYGLSVADDSLLFSQLDADLLLSGTVIDYTDPGGENMPSVYFIVYAIARQGYEMVWSSHSINSGDDGLHLFGLGRIHTAAKLSSQMTGKVVQMLALPRELWFPAKEALP